MKGKTGREYYDIISNSYDGLYKEEQGNKISIIKKIIAENNLLDEKSIVLDIGSGPYYADFGKDFGCAVFGIDPSIGLVKISLAKKISGFYAVVGIAESLPFKDNIFDLVVSITAVQNFSNIALAFDEMLRVGKKYFIISFLKKTNTAKKAKIEQEIKKRLKVIKKIEEKKDVIYFLSRL